ncbi:OmpA family protein [Duncaniella dubosii]|jgi:outer membrane protein OmpA-like peptidoglycan-associated protein|uniref:OmpA family protein n=2 Tax=Duncaniella TaxID=2518495 RepID=A0A4V1D2Z4_9BACT|nr:OmpA family protein [Duncaniella dubosii]MCX4283492.1 OmpA family protein [Duncaniella dubosii]QCD41218.1 OmpA family protein [Duncaniella dubosii]ROS86142.1 OmpA family protein [Muribaculaceae bacterium Isolate-080 (Janvier)]
MKINKLFLTASFALCAAFMANAQEAQEETEYVFQPHWYVQGQVGMQETLGETSFGKLASFNAQVGVGYRFNPVLGARLIFNGWTSKGSIEVDGKRSDWKWNYVAPTVNATVDLVNLIGGFNPERPVNAGIFAGIGANIAARNGEANDVNNALKASVYKDLDAAARPDVLRNIWTGTKARFVGQFGVYADYNLTSNLKLGLELQANVLPDGYNSKKAGNADWYFNGLVGVKYAFGTTFTKQKRKKCCAATAEPKIIEKIVEVPVEKIVVKEVIKEVPAPLTRDVFFKISTIKITKDEMYKVAEVARYMKTNPDTKVTVTGYADKGTGSMKLNLRLSAQRAEAVANALIKEYGIASDRITVKSMGEVEDQPYPTPAQNRVAICIVE